ncbi:MAG: L-lysine 6-transaminase [Acidobacteriota bacterium]
MQKVLNDFITPDLVHSTLRRHMLVDGLDLVIDFEKSLGSRIYDSLRDRYFIDFFSYFATNPIGLNHPHLTSATSQRLLARAAQNNPSNPDVYSVEMAEFVYTFARVAKPDYMKYLFWISSGTLAVENALKVAFDWKVRKNFAKGIREEKGHQILHFQQAFHGRSGYTLSMTNTFDARKTQYFAKFNWPRVLNPKLHFPLTTDKLRHVEASEEESVRQIRQALADFPDDIAAILIEPIQSEGGDNHFRPEFFRQLRSIADDHELLLIFDEVQTGMGLTGKMWASEYFVKPDIIAFAKKAQVGGIMVSGRIDDVPDNVFHVASRINSTWGGNLSDMVRCRLFLEIIEAENLLAKVESDGEYLLGRLQDLEREFPGRVSNARGRGLFCAIDFPDAELRHAVRRKAFENLLIILPCGERSLRFRTTLDIPRADLDKGLDILQRSIGEVV